jgi:hypothetical protein
MNPDDPVDRTGFNIALWATSPSFGNTVPFDELKRRIARFGWLSQQKGRIAEIRRIQSVTLDADTDVWSTDNAGKVVLLSTRLDDLCALLFPPAPTQP